MLLTGHFYYEMVETVFRGSMQLTGIILLSDMQLSDTHCKVCMNVQISKLIFLFGKSLYFKRYLRKQGCPILVELPIPYFFYVIIIIFICNKQIFKYNRQVFVHGGVDAFYKPMMQ